MNKAKKAFKSSISFRDPMMAGKCKELLQTRFPSVEFYVDDRRGGFGGDEIFRGISTFGSVSLANRIKMNWFIEGFFEALEI